ncbi:MAG: methylenetetrahydrofolate reductase [Lentisphaerae bacterium]|nr:methylenetetrahydrofolate reductase [Lentisphaerota bacterium]
MKRLREALAKREFAVTCEMVPGRGKEGVTFDAALQFAEETSASDVAVHAVSLTDNPGGNPAIMPDGLAREIMNQGLDVLVHFSCRDLNRNAFESRAMALARCGVDNLLVITGDYPSGGFEGTAAPVFDLDAVHGIRYLKAMNAGLEIPGRHKGTVQRLPPTDFVVGAVVSPFKLKEEEYLPQLFKLEKKLAAGADFVVPQLGYDMRKFLELKRYLNARGLNVPLLGNVYVLSRGVARAMHAGQVPGCVVTRELLAEVERAAEAGDKGKKHNLERAAKMVAAFKGMGFSGVHIGGFGLRSDDVRYIVGRAGELAPEWHKVARDIEFGREGEYYLFPPQDGYEIPAREADPLPGLGRARMPVAYRFSDWFHRHVFEPDCMLFRPLRACYRRLGKNSLAGKFSHFVEFATKALLFECRDCGDCALPDMANCCPQSACAKQQRNGACGGSIDGMCEVFPDERKCVWTVVYKRLKSAGRLAEMRERYVPPRRTDLAHTSSWANYFLGRDHAGMAAQRVHPG